MPRIDYRTERAQRQHTQKTTNRSGGQQISGVYALLLEQERTYGGEPDPRWAYTKSGQRGDPYPAHWRGKASLLADLEAGRPVQVDFNRLSRLLEKAGAIGQVVMPQQPERRVERFLWAVWRDRSVVGLLVDADDLVVLLHRHDA